MLTGWSYLQELWIFPLHGTFGAWIVLTFLYLTVSRPLYRGLISLAGVAYFFFASKLYYSGLLVLLLPVALWAAVSRWQAKGLWFFVPLLMFWVVFGHVPEAVGPGMAADLAMNGRLSAHVLGLFFFFRVISYGIAAGFRGERAGLSETVEYFFAPPFLLEPSKGFMLTFATFREPAESRARRQGVLWLAQGIFFQLLFAFFGGRVLDFVSDRFSLGVNPWNVGWFVSVGAAAFLLAYLEKARMSYMLAGLLRLSGRAIEPDFHHPWFARSLLDYWRRFHYWVLEFYMEALYQPFSYYLSRHMSAKTAVGLGIFLTFSIGTTLSHWLFYTASFSVTFGLGVLFAFFTAAHYFVGAYLARFARQWGWLGVPITWATVFFLYAFAYPAFGLGWSWEEMAGFFW